MNPLKQDSNDLFFPLMSQSCSNNWLELAIVISNELSCDENAPSRLGFDEINFSRHQQRRSMGIKTESEAAASKSLLRQL